MRAAALFPGPPTPRRSAGAFSSMPLTVTVVLTELNTAVAAGRHDPFHDLLDGRNRRPRRGRRIGRRRPRGRPSAGNHESNADNVQEHPDQEEPVS